MRRALPGVPYPLGATPDSEGVNFAIYSENARALELCLFDEDDHETRIPIRQHTAFVWHVYVPGVSAGARYAYRAYGEYAPARGLRYNPNVLLLDPYARATDGVERWDKGCFAYDMHGGREDLKPSDHDQTGAPRAIVVDPDFDWEGDASPAIPLHQSVIYETHVRGLTMRHPAVPPQLRGTYSGVAHPAMIQYFKELGITAVELMPVHAFVDEMHLIDRGLRNYWGYSSIGFFAPDSRYRSGSRPGSEVNEFKRMVKALHRAGIEVILDVVYNHTAEGNHLGPTLSFKGIDNAVYYRLVAHEPRYYFDYTGTGNTLNVRHPQVLTLIMDSLRYWAAEMHVDGFRFDLASSLARQLHEVDKLSSFFALIHQSPVLRHAKIIAEPWDVGAGGYQVGNFPVRWAEWNGRYRDAVRSLWRGDEGAAAEIGYRLTGSSDLYASSGRSPSASINFITTHDGSTLTDLVSYQHKHNHANGEDNRDGSDHELGWNCGVEGPSDDPQIVSLRDRQRRNLLLTLLISQGTPMLLGGDEFGRSQLGNNNAYCQDNELTWYDWDWKPEQRNLFEFVKRLLHLRRTHPALHRAHFFQGQSVIDGIHDIRWLRHDGHALSEHDWKNPATRSFGIFLAGRGISDVDEQGRPLVDDDLLILLNASHVDLDFTLPKLDSITGAWQLLVDTADDDAVEECRSSARTRLTARSMKFFRSPSRVVRKGGALHSLGASYRLQLSPAFGFEQAGEIVDYLAELGVTDVYCSPLLEAASGSTHGYDVVDHGRVSEALGGRAGLDHFTSRLRARKLGLLLDWVPNHMGIGTSGQNAWWDDVMENGPSSSYAEYFDIDWQPHKPGLEQRVLLPILSQQYGEALEAGELVVLWDGQTFRLTYHEHSLPVGPKTLASVVESICFKSGLPETDPDRQELESILSAMRHLPDRSEHTAEARRERGREKEVIKRRLRHLLGSSAPLSAALDRVLRSLNGRVGEPKTFDRLDALLGAQGYRLASWRVASEEINYRRFFDVNGLAAIRMESAEVFNQTHELLFELLQQGQVQGLRLDHTDGLYDPLGYFEALQDRFRVATADPALNPDDLARPVPVLVEKILERGETLSAEWPIDGTTGYELGAAALGVLVDAKAENAFTALYKKFTGDELSFADHAYRSKHHILRYTLASEVNMLGRELERIASVNRRWRDFTLISLTRALIEVLAAFPVYRTYLREGRPPSEYDERCVREAISAASRNNPSISKSVFAFLEEVLLLRTPETDSERTEHERFALRFQQLSGPVKAKAEEDTAFYRYTRFACLNEVGNNPARFGRAVEEFHAQNIERARAWPLSMVTTSTHDSKRGEDTSARMAVLSEMPDVWRRSLRTFEELATSARSQVDGQPAPSRSLEYLFYQTFLGVWPLDWDGRTNRDEMTQRMTNFMLKASKEAKQQTSWTSPNATYDTAVELFVTRMLNNAGFMDEMRQLCELVAPYGASNGLALTLLRMCSPGIADSYQGSELWSQTLVDPDNRRQIDFAARRTILSEIKAKCERDPSTLARDLLEHYKDGRIKLYVMHVALQARKRYPELFRQGDYEALPGPEHLVAFTRAAESQRMICVVARLACTKTAGERPFAVGDMWRDQVLRVAHAGRYRDLLTGRVLDVGLQTPLAEIFRVLPLALLIRESRASLRAKP